MGPARRGSRVRAPWESIRGWWPSMSGGRCSSHQSANTRTPSEIRRARELDPLSPFVNANLGTVLYIARRYHEAIDHFLNSLETYPHFYWTHWHLALPYI